MFLTVVIPSRNRSSELRATIGHFCQMIESAELSNDVDVICVNNFSTDDTESVCLKYAERYDFFNYHNQLEERKSAETSSLSAIDFARGKYVWIFGDDDTPLPGSLERLVRLLKTYNPEFALLNMVFEYEGRRSEYINSFDEHIYFEDGMDFFRSFGLITAVTTISCLCFKNKSFLREEFVELSRRSEIYSHSVAMFVSFFNKPILFVVEPSLVYLPTHESVELQKIGAHSRADGRSTYYAFSLGLIRLIEAASVMTGVPVSEISAFEEIIIDKTLWIVRHSLVWCFIARALMIERAQEPSASYTSNELNEIEHFASNQRPLASALIRSVVSARSSGNHDLPNLHGLFNLCMDRYEQQHFKDPQPINGGSASQLSLYFQPGIQPKSVSGLGARTVLGKDVDDYNLTIIIRCPEDITAKINAFVKGQASRIANHIRVECIVITGDTDQASVENSITHVQSKFSARVTTSSIEEVLLTVRGTYTLVVSAYDSMHLQSLFFALSFLTTSEVDALFLDRSCRFEHETLSLAMTAFYGDRQSTHTFSKAMPESSKSLRESVTRSFSPVIVKSAALREADHVITQVASSGVPLSSWRKVMPCSSSRGNLLPSSLLPKSYKGLAAEQLPFLNARVLSSVVSGRFIENELFDEVVALFYSEDVQNVQDSGNLALENLLFLVGLLLFQTEGPGTADEHSWVAHLRYLNRLWANEEDRKIHFKSRIAQPVFAGEDLLSVSKRTLVRMGLRRPNTGIVVKLRKVIGFLRR